MRLVIFGSRSFNDRYLLAQIMRDKHMPELVICGHARGADRLGHDWALDHHIPVKDYIPDWDLYGKSAGYRRNREMALDATHGLGFWDGSSRGTKHMIDIMTDFGRDLQIVRF